jgi:hypothetical protein
MSPAEKCLLLGIGAVMSAGSMSRWQRPDIGPAISYARRCDLAPSEAYKASAVALWSTAPEKQPCPGGKKK